MKPSTHDSSSLGRRSLVAAALVVLLGTATAVAQSSTGSGSSSYGSGKSGTSSTTSTSGTSASENARRNAQSDTSQSTSSATDPSRSTTDTSGTTGTTYGAGSPTSGTTDTAGGATTMTGRDSSAKLSWGDRRFVTKAADSGATELELAQLATERASNPEVKSFAEKLIQDHGMVNTELMALAGQKNVKIDKEDAKEDRAYRRLSKKSGTEFDQEFVEHMADMHESDVKMFEKASEDAKDSSIRSFASKHVDHLRDHLQQAQSLRQTIVPTGRTDESATRSSTGTYDSPTSGTTGSTSSTGTQSTSGTSETSGTTGTTGSTGSSYGTGSTTSGATNSSDTSTSSTKKDGSR